MERQVISTSKKKRGVSKTGQRVRTQMVIYKTKGKKGKLESRTAHEAVNE